MDNHQFINDFIQEAAGNLERVELGLLKLNDNIFDSNTINEIFRAVHSIKGTAGFFDLKNIVKLSHMMESLLNEIRNGTCIIDDYKIDVLLECNDALKHMVNNSIESDQMNIQEHIDKLFSLLNSENEKVEYKHEEHKEKNEEKCKKAENKAITVESFQNSFELEEKEKSILADGIKHGHKVYLINLNEDISKENILIKIKSIGKVLKEFEDKILFTTVLDKSLVKITFGNILTNIEQCSIQKKQNLKPVPQKCEKIYRQENSSLIQDSIRVKVSLLNDLMNLAGEMVLARNQLLRTMGSYKKYIPSMDNILQNIDYNTTQIQEKIMLTRMQPVTTLFNKFPRLTREISKNTGKNINLIMKGEEVELDKSIIQALEDPLTHLVRNSIDHGIESPLERKKRGKDQVGNITIEAFNESGYVYIRVEDDGSGVNLDKVKDKAVKKELASKDYIDSLDEKEIVKFILKPGFTTSEKVTDISGRGVGMDVVKVNIEKLGGTIEIDTEKNKGTVITLVLPLTLAIMSSIIVEVDGQKYALPRANLQEMIRIKEEEWDEKVENINGYDVLNLRGNMLPLIYLWDILNNCNEKIKKYKGIVRILIVKIGIKKFGVVVEKVCDEEEILVKPLPKYFLNNKCYAGVTIMGDGNVAMILDVKGIAERSNIEY